MEERPRRRAAGSATRSTAAGSATGSTAAQAAAAILQARIPGLALREPSARNGGDTADLLITIGEHRLALQVKSLLVSLLEDIRGRLAAGFMEANRLAKNTGAIPMAVVMLPRLGPKASAAASLFMSRHAPGSAWALLDRSGNASIVVPELGIDIHYRVARVEDIKVRRWSGRLFSDLNRWMMKVLLLADAPSELWSGPRGPYFTPSDLYRAVEVSPEMAHRLVHALEDQDFLRRTQQGLKLVRRSALLDLWRAEEEIDRREEIPVRWMMGRPRNLADVFGQDPQGQPEVVVGGFEACLMLGLLHARVPYLPEVHVLAPTGALLERYSLERCTPSEAHLWVVPCRHAQSVSRGSLVREGLRVVDPLQAALDVLHQPARGREQSDYLIREVLHLEEDR